MANKPKPEEPVKVEHVNANAAYSEAELASWLGVGEPAFRKFADENNLLFARTPRRRRVYSGRHFVIQIEHLALRNFLTGEMQDDEE